MSYPQNSPQDTDLPFLPDPTPESKIFNIKSANEWLEEAINIPDPIPLYDVLWYEGQTAFLFGGPGAGKSLYAIQIAHHISISKAVVYFDFELSQKQFAIRYFRPDNTFDKFPEKFYRIEFHRGITYTEDELVQEIHLAALHMEAKIIIIDNISFLLTDGEKATTAKNFMKKLDVLKKDHGYSILILGHTPKRDETRPIFLTDMAGSMALGNFIDSAFAIVRSFQNSDLRYVKQLKARDTVVTYDYDSVKVLQICKHSNGFLGLDDKGEAKENQHLKRPNEDQQDSKRNEVINLLILDTPYSKIAQQVGVSKGYISKVNKEWENSIKRKEIDSNDDLPF